MLNVQIFDKMLKEEAQKAAAAMYNRQALYLVYMIRFKEAAADIRAKLKELYGANYNAARGYLNKEIKAAEAVIKDQGLHKIIISNEKPAEIIRAAADYMQKNSFSYSKLFASEKAEKKSRAEVLTDFVSRLNYTEAQEVYNMIGARLDQLKAAAEAAAEAEKAKRAEAAKKAAEAEAAKKARAEKRAEAEAEKAKRAEARIKAMKAAAEKALEKARKINAELAKHEKEGKAAAALAIAKRQGAKMITARRKAAEAAKKAA